MPHKFGETFPAAFEALARNEDRLVTHYDVYHTIRRMLTYPEAPTTVGWPNPASSMNGQSLFGDVALDRSCQDAGVPTELCICAAWQDWERDGFFLAEFVIGQLNNEIATATARPGETTSEPESSCHRIVLHSVISAQWMTAQSSDTEVDQRYVRVEFITEAGPGYGRQRFTAYLFHLTWHFHNRYTHQRFDKITMRLSSITRVSTYGPFEACADPRVHPDRCLCSLPDGDELGAAASPASSTSSSADGGVELVAKEAIEDVSPYRRELTKGSGVMYLQRYKIFRNEVLQGYSFEFVNNSPTHVCITLHLDTTNFVFSRPEPMSDRVEARTTRYITSLRLDDEQAGWAWNHTIKWTTNGDCKPFAAPTINDNLISRDVRVRFSDAVRIHTFFDDNLVTYQVKNSRSMDVRFEMNLKGPIRTRSKLPASVVLGDEETKVLAWALRDDMKTQSKDWYDDVSWSWSWKTVD